ncbi:MAG: sigma-70 family RNA polymerase sigma factor, partial [Spirochaetia bacterium]|nr:sigma-70 family RNA polymerase sigma factor [Spirochaetia bacterium]
MDFHAASLTHDGGADFLGEDSEAQKNFETRFQETSKMIYNLGLRLFRDADDAMDFAQEVYLRAYTRLDKFRGESRFSTWLYSLALNLGLNKIRREKRVVEDSVDPNDFSNEAARDTQPLPDEQILASSDSELEVH